MGKMFDALQKMEREKQPELKKESPQTLTEDIVFDDKIVSFFESYSLAAEQFRRIKVNIILRDAESEFKTILVTSAMSGEGKSLISINLAFSIAEEYESHALLVDCDLRNPSFSRWFGFQNRIGVSDYLMGRANLSELLIKTPVDKLSVLPAGTLEDNPVELIGSNKMKELITELKKRYDDRFIIFDSSPLLATTEPSVLNKMVDGILLVIRSGETPRESVHQALKMLDKKKIVGVALNALEFKTHAMKRRYFGQDRYYYNYGYGHSRDGQENSRTFFNRIFGRK